MDDKEFFNILKAICYQLFSRKLMFLVFTGDPNKCNTWLLTNVDAETMRVYDESPAYHFAKLTIKNEDFLNEFYKRFPLFKTTAAVIRVVDFCASLAKAVALSDCEVSGEGEILSISYSEKSKLCEDLTEKQTKEIGVVLQDIEVQIYYGIWESGLITSENPYTHVLDEPSIYQDSNSILVVHDRSTGEHIQQALVIVQLGYLIPSLVPFNKAVKGQTNTVVLKAGYDVNTVIVTIEYDTPLLSAVITQPSQRWFVKK